ncbi:MAG TPA: 4Fe-4S binding protein [Solirubrobacteraceae bacterium]|nr:4Fe-4S binding protein [Solirubrobacteraceae bacterium]
MPHVVTQSCVGDGSCVYSCPVNCIQPTPDDPSFELAEMLYIDQMACVDCGACVRACPVDAIKPHTLLAEGERLFVSLNAAYHEIPRSRPSLAPVRPALVVRDRGEPLRVAIVGAGPASMYAAEEVLTIPSAHVSVYERLRMPYGLVRSGVAPDHRRTRRVSRRLDRIRQHPRLEMHYGVEVGRAVTHHDLLETHHAVIYGVGAATDRRLDIPGAESPRVVSATQLVAWYNGHPEYRDRGFDLSHPRVVVIGNGNVALDVARILTLDPRELAQSEISPVALAALRASRVEEVVVVARRGPEHAAFTLPELVGLIATPGVAIGVASDELYETGTVDAKLDLLRGLEPPAEIGRRIVLRFGLTPVRVHEPGTLELANPDGSPAETIDAGLVVTSIGSRGQPVSGLPFDRASGTVPNTAGRVSDKPGAYVVGWIKRGPSGFIGTNKGCAQDTVATLVADYNAGLLAPPRAAARRPRARSHKIPAIRAIKP